MQLSVFLSLNSIISFLEENMLTCQWKSLGMECTSCGIQRAIILILKGEFVEAFYMYPPIYTVIIMFGYLALHLKYHFKIGHKILIALFVFNTIDALINYVDKLY